MNRIIALQPHPAVAMLLTLTGILIGLLLSLLAAWGDYESTSYGFMKRANAPFRGLSCPVFLGRSETGTISIRLTNSTDHPVSAGVRTEISASQEPASNLQFVQLAPGERATVKQTIGPENIDLGSFILVSTSVFSMYPVPDQEMTCGVVVLPMAGGSQPLLIVGTTISLLLMSAGSYFLYRRGSSGPRSRSVLFMTLATALALFFSFRGSWVQALFLIIMVVLTFLITSGSLFESPRSLGPKRLAD
jgi:hypothetical protein